MPNAEYAVFQALDPFFRVVEQGLREFVDGGHYFDTIADDAAPTCVNAYDQAMGANPNSAYSQAQARSQHGNGMFKNNASGAGPAGGGVNAVMCDGSVRFVKNGLTMNQMQALLSRAGGEVISFDY